MLFKQRSVLTVACVGPSRELCLGVRRAAAGSWARLLGRHRDLQRERRSRQPRASCDIHNAGTHALCLHLLDDALHAQADIGDLRVKHILQSDERQQRACMRLSSTQDAQTEARTASSALASKCSIASTWSTEPFRRPSMIIVAAIFSARSALMPCKSWSGHA